MGRGLDRCFAAVVSDWEGTLVPRLDAPAGTVRRLIERLTALGVEVMVVSGGNVDEVDRQLRARPAGPGRLHLCVDHGSEVFRVEPGGPRRLWGSRRAAGEPPASDESEVGIACNRSSGAMRWAFDYLATRGIGPGLVLLAGERLGAAPARASQVFEAPNVMVDVLDDLARRLRWAVPDIDDDPAWTVHLPVQTDRDQVDATLTTLGNGRFGARGVREEDGNSGTVTLTCGVYVGEGSQQRLLEAPNWIEVAAVGIDAADERVLDLRTGILVRDAAAGGEDYRSARLVSLKRPELMALRAQSRTPLSGATLSSEEHPAQRLQHGRDGRIRWMRVLADVGGGVAAAAWQQRVRSDGWHGLERRVTAVSDAHRTPSAREAVDRLSTQRRIPFAALVAEQRLHWAARWDDADVVISGDPEMQRAARFALFHLQSTVPSRGEAAVGARGLSGTGYRGHVFWDADVFVLPVLAAIRPAAARAMLEYRLRRLDAARASAASTGRRGARFPWESARDGTDVTPKTGVLGDRNVPICTGDAEEHIVADVAWAARHYATFSADTAFLSGNGWPLMIETARYWASRIQVEADGRGHLYGVIGPDEYHEMVNDNAYTNLMARWNLRRAAELARRYPSRSQSGEAEQWEQLADCLVDGYDAGTGVFEQFAGYHKLEPLMAATLGRVPVAADLLLGPERLAATQIIKQPDVLMAYHLIPDELPPGTLAANLDFYGPRTAHGSSLSPAVHASLLARAGDPDAALEWLRLAARLDLDDLAGGATASGLHLATLAGVWHALAFGFAGITVDDGGVLRLAPVLPTAWSSLDLRLRVRGSRVQVSVTHDGVRVHCDPPLQVALPETQPRTEPGGA